MNDFINYIKIATKRSRNMNDKRIMITALNILDLEFVITNEEIEFLNEIFSALKEDYTLLVASDKETLEQVVIIQKQAIPIVENKHDVGTLYNNLKNIETSNIENLVLNFFKACEHIEEDEVMVINQIIDMLENNWSLRCIDRDNINGNFIRTLKFKPTYNKIKKM